MGFYSNKILPGLINIAMSQKEIAQLRIEVLSEAKGKVLEIGFGTGLNLPHYPATVKHLTAVDVNPGMEKLARKRIETSTIPVQLLFINGEKLPFENQSFDTVVSTWTLCSIGQVDQALAEIQRVLKLEGRFIFIEHGLSPDVKVQRWQNRLNPLQKKIVGNCHLNRSIKELVEGQGLKIEVLKQFYYEKEPRPYGYTYQGIASR